MNRTFWLSITAFSLFSLLAFGDIIETPPPGITLDINKSTHTLTLIKDGKVVQTYDVIVGKKVTPTPDMEATFDSIDINPTWNPTEKLQKRLKTKPNIMKQDGVVTTKDGKLYAPPGKDNPLGKARLNVKFRYPIKIHGTNQPELFKTDKREYSLGCIRVLEIQDLVNKIVDGNIDWNRAYTVKLNNPVYVIVH